MNNPNSKIMKNYKYLRENYWNGKWSKRILSELAFVMEASYYNDNTYLELVNSAMDKLICYVKESGAIDREIAIELENMLSPTEQLCKSYEVLLVGHAHIDMNWCWGFHETVNITIDTFETMLQLMEEYPQFKFSQSQAAVYKIMEQYKPELLKRVKQKIHEGRWEVTASTWVENDKNMSGSESHARQIIETKTYLSKLIDIPMESLDMDFEPDTFGHPENMPEVFKNGGIKYYYHCRGNDKNIAYRWQAPSGAEVLVYREPIWYNDQKSEYDCLGFVPGFCNKFGLKTAMKVYGVGDHGGGPTRQQLNRFTDMQTWPLMPVIKFSGMRPFFHCLDKVRDSLPLVKRELNYIYTGCYTSEARIKRGNKICEDRIYEAEFMDAAAHTLLDGYTTPSDFGKAWENILFNQFHDILPGSGVVDTIDAAMGQYQKTLATTQVNMKDAMTNLCKNMDTTCFGDNIGYIPDSDDERSMGAGCGYGNSDYLGCITSQVDRSNSHRRVLTVFNPTPQHRCEVANVIIWDWEGDPKALYATDASGRKFACQFVKQDIYYAHTYTTLLMEVDVPPMGYSTYILDEKCEQCFDTSWAYFRACGNVQNPPVMDYITDEAIVLENENIKVEFSPQNLKMQSFIDKKSGKQLISQPSCGFRFVTENPVHGMTSWRIGHYMNVKDVNTKYPAKLLSVIKGKVRQSIQYEIPFENSLLTVTAFVDAHSSVVEFETKVSWHELGSMDKGIPQLNFTVPFNYSADKYLCNIPMGVIERDPLNQDVPCIGFMAGVAKNDPKSLMVVSDCKYGFRGCDDSISLTLLRSSFGPDPSPDQCNHTFRIGVGVANKDDTVKAYEKFVHPLNVCTNQIHEGTLAASHSFMDIKGDAVIQSVKMSMDKTGVIIRMYNTQKQDETVTLTFDRNIKKAEATDILENYIEDILSSGNDCTFTLGGGAQKTVKICF